MLHCTVDVCCPSGMHACPSSPPHFPALPHPTIRCWLCGEKIFINGPFPRHYDRRNPTSSCAGMQFTNDGNEEQGRSLCGRVLCVLFYFSPLALPFYALAVVLYVLVTLLSIPCLIGHRPYREAWLQPSIIIRMVTACWVLLLTVLFALGCFVGITVMWLVGLCLGAMAWPVWLCRSRTDFRQEVWCCCCWPLVLFREVWGQDDEPPIAEELDPEAGDGDAAGESGGGDSASAGGEERHGEGGGEGEGEAWVDGAGQLGGVESAEESLRAEGQPDANGSKAPGSPPSAGGRGAAADEEEGAGKEAEDSGVLSMDSV